MDELAKLRWQCRRGTKELDLLLNGFLDNGYRTANPADKDYFLQILELEDSVLIAQYNEMAERLCVRTLGVAGDK